MKKYTTVARWAKALGSQAKTRRGQRAVIINSFRRASWIDKMEAGGSPVFDRGAEAKERYLAERLYSRQWRSPAAVAERDRKGEEALKIRFLTGALQNTRLESLAPGIGYTQLGDWYIRVSENATYDYKYYAASYGHPKKTVTGRTVHIRRVLGDGTFENRDVEVSSFRGAYLLNALVQAGITESQAGGCLMSIRLHAAYNVRVVRSGRSLKIYERTLAGVHVDYCAMSAGVTYHAATVRQAIAGLRSKLAGNKRSHVKGGKVDWALCKKLGFCNAGIRQFATTFSLDTRRTYTAQEISDLVKSNLAGARPFEAELRTLAAALKYPISI